MFPDNAEELWDDLGDYEEESSCFDNHSEEDLKNELAFLQEIKRLKELGKFIFVFEQRYVF